MQICKSKCKDNMISNNAIIWKTPFDVPESWKKTVVIFCIKSFILVGDRIGSSSCFAWHYIKYITITKTITYIMTTILFRMSTAAQDLYNQVSIVVSLLLSLSPLYVGWKWFLWKLGSKRWKKKEFLEGLFFLNLTLIVFNLQINKYLSSEQESFLCHFHRCPQVDLPDGSCFWTQKMSGLGVWVSMRIGPGYSPSWPLGHLPVITYVWSRFAPTTWVLLGEMVILKSLHQLCKTSCKHSISSLVSVFMMMSSAINRWFIRSFPSLAPIPEFCSLVQRSLTYRLNRILDKLHPCLRPLSGYNFFVLVPPDSEVMQSAL